MLRLRLRLSRGRQSSEGGEKQSTGAIAQVALHLFLIAVNTSTKPTIIIDS